MSITFSAQAPRDEVPVWVIKSNRDGPWITPIDKLSFPNHGVNPIDTSHLPAFSASPRSYCVDAPGYWIHGPDIIQYIRVAKKQTDATHYEIDYWGNTETTPVGILTAELH